MQRNHFDDGQQQFGRRRNKKYIIGNLGYFRISFGRYGHQSAAPGLDLFHDFERAPVAQHRIRIMVVAGGQHHDWKVLVDQRVGAVLEFTGRVAFGVRVGNLLKLECSFARNCVMDAASEIEELFRLMVILSELFGEFVPGFEITLDRVGETL